MQTKTFASWSTGGGSADLSLVKPQVGTGSPEWVISSRFPWDRYIDAVGVSGMPIEYQNPNVSWNVGWRVMQETSA